MFAFLPDENERLLFQVDIKLSFELSKASAIQANSLQSDLVQDFLVNIWHTIKTHHTVIGHPYSELLKKWGIPILVSFTDFRLAFQARIYCEYSRTRN